MLKKITITVILLIIMLFSGCGINSNINITSDEQLLSFLPVNGEEFSGDGDYFHVSKQIDLSKEDGFAIAYVKGEVKNNFTGGTGFDYNFTITLKVTNQEIIQSYEGSHLNESDFDEVVLLKLPLELDKSWTFSTKNKAGKKQKVIATITEIFNNGKGIKVRYETKGGYYEERTIYEKHGVVDFVRQVNYKNESTVTGYHSALEIVKINNEATSDNSLDEKDNLTEELTSDINNASMSETTGTEATGSQDFPTVVIEVPIAYYNLILGFEQAWSSYINNSSEDLLKFVDENSPAYQKIMEIDRSSNPMLEFVKYYPYEMTIDGDVIVINIVETFITEDKTTIKNKVSYKIANANTLPKVYDFEVIK